MLTNINDFSLHKKLSAFIGIDPILKQSGSSVFYQDKITNDKNVVSLAEILTHYFRIIDPFSVNKQGNGVGLQYRTGIYYDDSGLENKIFKFIHNDE